MDLWSLFEHRLIISSVAVPPLTAISDTVYFTNQNMPTIGMLNSLPNCVICGRHLEFQGEECMLRGGGINNKNGIHVSDLLEMTFYLSNKNVWDRQRPFWKKLFFWNFPPKIERVIGAQFKDHHLMYLKPPRN